MIGVNIRTWDANLLLEASRTDDLYHRAFKDACLLYKAIIEALSKWRLE